MNENQPNQSQEDEPLKRLQLLLLRAARGDQDALPALCECLDAHPEIWQEAGNLALQSERMWVRMIAGTDLLLEQSLKRQLEAMRAELSGPSPSRLERCLVERVVQCWLQTYHADAMCARGTGRSDAQKAHLQRRQDQAQKAYLAAIKALMTCQKHMPKGESQQGGLSESSGGGPGEGTGSSSRRENQGTEKSKESFLPEFLAGRIRGLVGSEN
jgi:hypothetical protein